MKEIKRTRTIEEVYGYEASDGNLFHSAEECKKYEKTANCVINADYRNLHKVESLECRMSNDIFGCDANGVDFIKIENVDQLSIINKYIYLHTGNDSYMVKPDMIGKTVMLFWQCGREYVIVITPEEYITGIQRQVNRCLEKLNPSETENKEKENK